MLEQQIGHGLQYCWSCFSVACSFTHTDLCCPGTCKMLALQSKCQCKMGRCSSGLTCRRSEQNTWWRCLRHACGHGLCPKPFCMLLNDWSNTILRGCRWLAFTVCSINALNICVPVWNLVAVSDITSFGTTWLYIVATVAVCHSWLSMLWKWLHHIGAVTKQHLLYWQNDLCLCAILFICSVSAFSLTI